MGGKSEIDKPDFGVLANAINLEPTLTAIDVEAISRLLPDGEAANKIAALIASDIELVLSE